MVYLQHASDPIAWWNPDLLFTKPDWLREPRGYDVSPEMEWIPVVTFLHGHVYIRDVANAWADILAPLNVLDAWSAGKTAKLRPQLLRGYSS